MNEPIDRERRSLTKLRLPELQARFAEVVGESTRCPNRTWIIRRILESRTQADLCETRVAADPVPSGVPLRNLSIDELRARHLAVIGRPTGSHHVGYLRWRLRQAERGRIPIGPRRQLRCGGEVPEFKVLPFRMEATVISSLDSARKRLGLSSRAELLRYALHSYLLGAGESEVAELLRPGSTN